MTEFHVDVVRIGRVEKHPNADSLSITRVHGDGGYPVIFRTGDYHEGDLAVYVPIDSVVPVEDMRWAFLAGHTRIKAKRLRGIFSMGLLTHADPSWEEGRDVGEELGIVKHEPAVRVSAGRPGGQAGRGADAEDAAGLAAQVGVYDLEGLRRYPNLLREGEVVAITEKIHGSNARFMHDGVRLWVGSRTRWLRESWDPMGGVRPWWSRAWQWVRARFGLPIDVVQNESVWWQVARRLNLAERLAAFPGHVFFGEVYGEGIQDLTYGVPASEGARLAIFDIQDTKTREFLAHDRVRSICVRLGLDAVPTLYVGLWRPDLAVLAEGKSTMPGTSHVREGIVVRPFDERVDLKFGRVILKLAGEGYLLRKSA